MFIAVSVGCLSLVSISPRRTRSGPRAPGAPEGVGVRREGGGGRLAPSTARWRQWRIAWHHIRCYHSKLFFLKKRAGRRGVKTREGEVKETPWGKNLP